MVETGYRADFCCLNCICENEMPFAPALGGDFSCLAPRDWYVSTNGAGDGSLGIPWSLQMATTNPAVKPGDTDLLGTGFMNPSPLFPNSVLAWRTWLELPGSRLAGVMRHLSQLFKRVGGHRPGIEGIVVFWGHGVLTIRPKEHIPATTMVIRLYRIFTAQLAHPIPSG